MNKTLRSAAALTALMIAVLSDSSVGKACAFLVPMNAALPHVEREEVLIESLRSSSGEIGGREALTRQVRFQSDAPFAFVVPVPSRPIVRAMSNDLWEALAFAEQTEPKIVQHRSFEFFPSLIWAMTLSRSAPTMQSAAASLGEIEVLESGRAGSLDYSILKSEEGEALGTWLEEHGFARRDAFDAWLNGYAQRGFYVVAFQYRPNEADVRVLSETVRLEFESQSLFFPFSEPDDQVASAREARPFRLRVLGPDPVDAKLGGQRFAAETTIRRELPTSAVQVLRPFAAVRGGQTWLTNFVQSDSRRGADDLIFSADPSLPSLEPERHETVDIHLPVAEPVLLMAGIAYLVFRTKRRSPSKA